MSTCIKQANLKIIKLKDKVVEENYTYIPIHIIILIYEPVENAENSDHNVLMRCVEFFSLFQIAKPKLVVKHISD
jgi:hypothetical protein